MSTPRPDTVDSTPVRTLPIPLIPSEVLVPSTPTQESHEERTLVPDPSSHLDPPVTSYAPSPSPTTRADTFYNDQRDKLPFKLDIFEALTEANVGLPPKVLTDEEKLRTVTDAYALLTIIAKLGADHSSYLNSMLMGVAAMDSCITELNISAAVEAASNRRENEVLRREIAGMRKEIESNGTRLNRITDTLLEVKEAILEGPRPTGKWPTAPHPRAPAQAKPREFHNLPGRPQPTPEGARVVILDRIGHVPVPPGISWNDLLSFCEGNGLDCNGILAGRARAASLEAYLVALQDQKDTTTPDPNTMNQDIDIEVVSDTDEPPVNLNHAHLPPPTEYNHPEWVTDSQMRQAEPQVLEGKDYIRANQRANQLAAIKEQNDTGWVTMARKNTHKKSAKGILPMAPPPPRAQGVSGAQPSSSSPLSTFPLMIPPRGSSGSMATPPLKTKG
jgi:hypothetical protein